MVNESIIQRQGRGPEQGGITFEDLLRRLHEVTGHAPKKSGDQFVAFCPCHESDGGKHTPSLKIKQGEKALLLHCFGGCSVAEICAALGIKVADLFYDDGDGAGKPAPKATPPKTGPAAADAAPKDNGGASGRIVAEYDYCDENGVLLFQVVRLEGKRFFQRRPDPERPGQWLWNLDGTPRPLYRLQEVKAAPPTAMIFIVEGEKDADYLVALGFVATCNSGGAMKWHTLSDDSALYGRRVAIIADKDTVGRRHAQDVARRLSGKVRKIKIVEMPGDAKDVSDWLDSLDCKEAEELCAALLNMAETAPAWTAETAQSAPDDDEPDSAAVVRNLGDVTPTTVLWLWRGRIPRGKLTLFCGDPGLGKSLLALTVAARVSNGHNWPDAPGERFTPDNVLLLTAEDDAADTVVPRLKAAGADLNRISVIDAIRRRDDKTHALVEDLVRLDEDVAVIAREVKKRSAVLLIIDPITAYTGKVDDYKNSETRGMLAKLAKMAAETGCAVLCVSHLRKSGGKAVHSILGSLAYTAAARMVWLVARDKSDPDRRLFVAVKANLAKDTSGLSFIITSEGDSAPVLSWGTEPVYETADELLDPWSGKRPGPPPDKSDEAMEWLTIALSNGPREASEIYAEAEDSGIHRATLIRAKSELGIQVSKAGFQGAWVWRMPASDKESPKVLRPTTQNILSAFEET